MRVLLDANIFISYLLNIQADDPIPSIVEAGVLGEFTLLLPEALLEEFSTRIVNKPYLAKRIRPEEVQHLTATLVANGEVIPKITGTIPAVTRDPKDDYLLAYAVVGDADFLVTGDEDLLVFKQVRAVRICRPRDFVEILLKHRSND